MRSVFETKPVKPLVLAGGESSRMGSSKHMLPFVNAKPLFLSLLSRLRLACPEVTSLYISLRNKAQALEVETVSTLVKDLVVVLDTISDDMADVNIGPAAGLLAAYRHDPHAYWLVVACDYPLLPVRALTMLQEEYQEPITCFTNDQGWCEPLLGIWSPQALRMLKDNVAAGTMGPSRTVKCLHGKLIHPTTSSWLINTNTPEEWQQALRVAAKDSSLLKM